MDYLAPEMDETGGRHELSGDQPRQPKRGTRGAWSPEEDRLLIQAVQTYGSRWSVVAGHVRTRSSTQCARRWSDTLDPRIDKSPWTPEQDQVLLQAVAQHGRSWANIAKTYFPGRTGLALKNRFTVIGKPRAESTSPVDPYMQSGPPQRSPTSMGMHYSDGHVDPTINNNYSYSRTWPSDRNPTMQGTSVEPQHWTGDPSFGGLGAMRAPAGYSYDLLSAGSQNPTVQYPHDWQATLSEPYASRPNDMYPPNY
ncbi:hypothetical protein AAF712_000236 [Marasmius tenuissimus]|uniref:Uncharacterized protein n=1 Tax=Marasmius tenuissimus TaxID=585030 RepID=A0ABR3AFX0_9AGAR